MDKSTEELALILSKSKNISKYISNNEKYFLDMKLSEYLELLLKENNLNKASVIKNSNINIQYAYEIFNGDKTKPSRNKILQLAFAMNLNLKDSDRLLKISGHNELYAKNKRDSIIIYAINNKMSLIECNNLLFELSEDILE